MHKRARHRRDALGAVFEPAQVRFAPVEGIVLKGRDADVEIVAEHPGRVLIDGAELFDALDLLVPLAPFRDTLKRCKPNIGVRGQHA